jgi:membrane protein DedA with SNARE-associated domain
MIHGFLNLHLDVVAGVLTGSTFGYVFGRLHGRGRRR